MKIKTKLFFICVVAVFSCTKKQEEKAQELSAASFSIEGFDALSGYGGDSKDSIRLIELDYENAITEGFVIPSKRQSPGGKFVCRFRIKNTSGKPQSFGYKIYYQDESYKMSETDSFGKLNPLSSENFYGSYNDPDVHFRNTELIPADDKFHEITDSITITGNPRNEQTYYDKGKNDRWKRNPRVGIYSFLLAVTTSGNLSSKKIPDYIQDITTGKDNYFISPYYYFIYGEGKSLANTLTQYSTTSLRVRARPDLGSGIYLNRGYFEESTIRQSSTPDCGNDTNLFYKAAFAQFIHYIDESTRMENIPLVADVLKDNYSKRDYNWNRSFYRREELIGITPTTAKRPCETVYSDPQQKKIVIHNPKSAPGKWLKENVGIISRHGLTYGKICVKAKLTELLNKNNVWNGLTNAIWMITQSEDQWNFRRPCNKEGYMATYWGGPGDKRANRVGYSEIDFEILKTPPYCPDQTFPPIFRNPTNDPHDISSWDIPLPEEILKDDSNITVACTNWDMACWEPENFGVGCNTVKYDNLQFEAHRWDHWYRAVTEKTPASDDLLFGSKYFYFEIDWRPTEIIWRIGPEKDKMFTVGYMNDKMTSIPDNQMLLIVTQEFHNTQWWPGSPYQQKNIPFPANDIFGEIYEVTIE